MASSSGRARKYLLNYNMRNIFIHYYYKLSPFSYSERVHSVVLGQKGLQWFIVLRKYISALEDKY